MPVYRYSGYRADGAGVSGTLDADGRRSAIERLKEDGILAEKVEAASKPEAAQKRRLFARRSNKLPLITRNLATLISSGVPVVEALSGLMEDEEEETWKNILMEIKEQVRSGSGLAAAFESFPEVFPEFYIGMVAAGEASGALDRILMRLADFLESTASLKARVRTAMIYPAFMVVVSAGILSFLLSFVVPKISRIFENTGSALPILTRLLLAISNFMHAWWWAVLAVLALLSWIFIKRYKAGRASFDARVLKLPLIGRLVLKLNVARFARTLGLLLEGGLPIVKAIKLASKSMGNAHLRLRADSLVDRVVQGKALAAAMKETGIFPHTLITLVSTGERSGELDAILLQTADAFEADFDRGVSNAVAVLEPALIVAMGISVGLIVVSILLPIFSMNQLIR